MKNCLILLLVITQLSYFVSSSQDQDYFEDGLALRDGEFGQKNQIKIQDGESNSLFDGEFTIQSLIPQTNNNQQEILSSVAEEQEHEIEEKEEQQEQENKNVNEEHEEQDENSCNSDDQCPSLHICKENECVHKDLFPLTGQEIVGICVILVLVGFAQAGGIGGGPILMPILLGIMNYDTKQAIALSFVLIFGGSCGNFLNNSGNKTQNNTPLIWYDLVLISLPFLMAGAIIGVAINHFLPSSFITIILIYVLYGSVKKTYKKYKQMVQVEEREKSEQNIPLVDIHTRGEDETYRPEDLEPTSPELDQIYAKERIQYPQEKYLKMFVVLATIIVLSILKGGKGLDSVIGISPCGMGYWVMNLIIVATCIYISKRFSLDMLNWEEKKTQHNFDFKKYGEKFDEVKVKDTGKAAVVAGVVGGLLGLGGGVILTPKWLEMGIPSDRVASTATFTVCFTSFISFFTTFLAGKYQILEVVVFWVLSFIASFFVSRFLKYLVDKYKKKSILIGILLIVIMLALTMLPIIQIAHLAQYPSEIFEFGKLC